jgi:UDP-GlcNAc:undecaprenyl-phosphate GlcNAc-1-phosphate transferase
MSLIPFLFAITISFFLVVISIPAVIRVARKKHLYDYNDGRKIHTQIVPALGGVAIYYGFVISTILATGNSSFDEIKFLIASITFVFFIGLKDDLIVVSNKKKFVVQVFAVLLIIFMTNLHLTNFHGFLGLYKVNYTLGILATLFIMLLTINAYNLIDGIDGLASGLAIMAAAIFGIFFITAGDIPYAVLSFSLVGSLSGFFFYNVFGSTNKLFMGDAGSLITGMVVSALIVRFNEIDASTQIPVWAQNSPALSFAIVLVPLVDTVRVFSIRLINGKSPFAPDTNHVHHRLLLICKKHAMITLIILFANILFIAFAIWMNAFSVNINIQFPVLITSALFVSAIPAIIIKYRGKNGKRMEFPVS